MDVSQNLDRLSTLILDGIDRARRAGDEGFDLMQRGKSYANRWVMLQYDILTFTGTDWEILRLGLVNFYNVVIPWSKKVNLLSVPDVPSGAVAEAKAKAGASWFDQTLVTLGLKSPEEVYVPKLPGLPGILGPGGLPGGLPALPVLIGVGALAFLFLRR